MTNKKSAGAHVTSGDTARLDLKVISRTKRNFMVQGNLFPSSVIDYRFDTKHPLIPSEKAKVLNVFKHLEENTCLHFVEKANTNTGMLFTNPARGGPCYADIGYNKNAMTTVNLPTGCGDLAAIVHEVFHSLNQAHEQTNALRYRYAIINWSAMPEGKRFGYTSGKDRYNGAYGGYDVFSVMHYALRGKGDALNMIMLDPRMDGFYMDNWAVGDMKRSFTDFMKVNKAYKCTDSCTSLNCKNTGYVTKTQNNQQCHCVCPTHLSGPTCEKFEPVGSAKNCNKMIKLAANQKVTITSPKDENNPNNTYQKGARCIYFVVGPPGSRIKATLTNLQLSVSQSIDARKQCYDHWVGVTLDRISDPFFKYCGSIPRQGKTQEVFLKSTLNPEANLMMLAFDSTRNEKGLNYDGSGVSIDVEAYMSGCVTKKCRSPGVCVDSKDMKTSECVCSDGYSGPTCSDVTKNDVVTTTFDEDMERVSFFKIDETAKGADFFFYTEIDRGEYESIKPLANSGSLVMGRFISKGSTPGKGRLVSDANFEEGERCLSFRFLLMKEPGLEGSTYSVWLSGEGVARHKVWEKSESKDKTWEKAQVKIPSMKGLKIEFEFNALNEGGENAVDDFVLQPKCSGSCFPSPCKNAGRCYVSDSGTKCSCPYGFTGKLCEITPCPTNYCKNKGLCIIQDGKPACRCNIPFTGPHCETKICAVGVCKNEGMCTPYGEDNNPSYVCKCTLGWTGKNCDEPMCKADTCKNGGECSAISSTQFECYCKQGFTGQRCEQKQLGACSPNPCKNGGACALDEIEEYKCTCPSKYSGKHCEKASGPCSPNPCKNYGKCALSGSSFKCTCDEGFGGDTCQYETCFLNCENGGTCLSINGKEVCKCAAGYAGATCTKKAK